MAQKSKLTPGQQKTGAAAGVLGLFALIVAAVVQVEGGFVDHPDDPGGATNFGVTERVARDSGFTGNMRDLQKQDAVEIYTQQYIINPGYDDLVALDFYVAEEVIDIGVNAGPSRASRWLQESLNHYNNKGSDYPDIVEDGRFGPAGVRAYKALQRRRGKKLTCELMLKAIDAKQAQHYMRLASRSSKFESFMVGWMRTRVGTPHIDKCGTVPEVPAAGAEARQ